MHSFKFTFYSAIKNYKIEIIALVIIITISLTIGIPMRDTWTQTYFVSDDVDTLSVAISLRDGKGLLREYQAPSYLLYYFKPLPPSLHAEDLVNLHPTISQPLSGKGPIYYLLLSSVNKITNANPETWYFWGSILNGILTVFLLIISFIYCRKYFGKNIAIISTFLISIMTVVVMYSVRVVHYPLLSLFIISAFLFVEKTKRDFFLFGLFSGLAHLTHPIGIIPVIAYSIFLLIKKEFKGFGIVTATWFVVLLPWMIRNTLTFGGFGHGLYIPYSDNISEILGLERFGQYALSPNALALSTINPFGEIKPFDVFGTVFSSQFDYHYHMITIMIILFCIGLSLLSFEGIRKHIKNIKKGSKNRFVIFGIIFALASLVLFLSYESNEAIEMQMDYVAVIKQSFLIFVLPLIMIIILIKIRKDFFRTNIPRIQKLIVFFGFISFIFLFLSANQQGRSEIEIKQFLPFIIIGVPLGIFGIERTLKFILKNEKSAIISLIIFILLIPVSTLELANGYNLWQDIGKGSRHVSAAHDEMNKWILDNLNGDEIALSDVPPALWLKTGINSVTLPTYELNEHDVDGFEDYLTRYQASYIILHYDWDTTVFERTTGDYYYERVFAKNLLESNKNFQVYRVNKVLDAEKDHLAPYIAKIAALKMNHRIDEATELYKKLGTEEIESINLHLQAKIHAEMGEYNSALKAYLLMENQDYDKPTILKLKNLIKQDVIFDKKLLKNLIEKFPEPMIVRDDDLFYWVWLFKRPDDVSVALMDDNEVKKANLNSLKIIIDSTKGFASIRHDYGKSNLQNWSFYENLEFWFKGENSGSSLDVTLRGENRERLGAYHVVDDTNSWKILKIPLNSTYTNLSEIREVEFEFFQGQIFGQFWIDEIKLTGRATDWSRVLENAIQKLEMDN